MRKRPLREISTEELLHWLDGVRRYMAAATHPRERAARRRQALVIARELVLRGVTAATIATSG